MANGPLACTRDAARDDDSTIDFVVCVREGGQVLFLVSIAGLCLRVRLSYSVLVGSEGLERSKSCGECGVNEVRTPNLPNAGSQSVPGVFIRIHGVQQRR